ncbi:hypothetical protein Tco_0834507 [Tanacetum coccineum]
MYERSDKERVRVISKEGRLWSESGLEVLGETSIGLSRKGLFGCGEGVFFEEKGEEFGFNSKEDEVVPRVEDVSLVDGVFKVAFGGVEMMILIWVKDWRKKLEWKPWMKKRKNMMEKNEEGAKSAEAKKKVVNWSEKEETEKAYSHEKYLCHPHHLRDERMMGDQRRKRRRQKCNNDLFLCQSPSLSFILVVEQEDT